MPDYVRDSYEYRLLNWLTDLDRFLVQEKIGYALFGGGGVAAYIGHLPRKLHDIDLIIFPPDQRKLSQFLNKNGYQQVSTPKSHRGEYLKFVLTNHVYELITSVFPGKFRLFNVDKPDFPLLGTYDFTPAMQKACRKVIRTLDAQGSASVRVVPIEDLIISKLWPTFEPNTVHDLLLLFATPDAQELDASYMRQRLDANENLKRLCYQTFQYLERAYPRTAWYDFSEDKFNIKRVSDLLRESVFVSPASHAVSS